MTDQATFTARLQAEGYTEILTREIAPGFAAPEHTHPYDARGLTLAGEFTVVSAAGTQDCPVGKFFELTAGTPHTEASGSAGATLLIGRRPRA
jgi:quercetin dioxygenase-like cupin family protein